MDEETIGEQRWSARVVFLIRPEVGGDADLKSLRESLLQNDVAAIHLISCT